jgi:uncharacterized protein (DUF488 family)
MQIFTIGHSTHNIEEFIGLLKKNGIDSIADVRSSPYSKYSPQFNSENLKPELEKNKIKYVFMGDELGARRTEPEAIDQDGKINFGKVRRLDSFKKGISRLKTGIEKGFKIAIMCAEKDPFECHRFSLVCYSLQKDGVQIGHILEDGSIMDNLELEKRFLSKVPDMFKTKEQEIEAGYKIIENKIAFVREDKE